jgi:CSLREA domain-containing protein
MLGKGPPARQATRSAAKPTTLMTMVLLVAMVGVVAALSFVAYAPHAHALGTLITVDTAQDESNSDGDCSLREAIQAADTNASVDGCAAGSSVSRDTIVFSLGSSPAEIAMSAELAAGGEAPLLPDITDSAGLLIDGGSASVTVYGLGEPEWWGWVFFTVSSGAMLKLENLTIARSSGGIFNEGTLGLIDSTVSGLGGSHRPSAISNSGTLRVRNSTISWNRSYGSAISNGGMLTVTDSTFSQNQIAFGSGGAISNGGTIEITNSTFSENRAESAAGGAILNGGTLRVRYSTFSQNSGTEEWGAIYNTDRGTASLSNTIVARSTWEGSTSSEGNCSGTITDEGHNIEDGTSCSFSEANNSLSDIDPKLAPTLANNGGPTQTIKLLKGSPAINAIPKLENGCGTEVTTDQRGVKRPQGKGCEVGAFEKKKPKPSGPWASSSRR